MFGCTIGGKQAHTPFKVAFAAALAFALGFFGFDFGPISTYVSTNTRVGAKDLRVKDIGCNFRVRCSGTLFRYARKSLKLVVWLLCAEEGGSASHTLLCLFFGCHCRLAGVAQFSCRS